MCFKNMKRSEKVLLLLILLTGFGVRLFMLGRFPDGINQDEAYAGYEAYSLFHFGMDADGFHNPVYFNAWGSGMNALYSYLTMPFLLLSGGNLRLWAIRLPQALFACLTLFVFYLILRKLYDDRRVCLFGLLVLAVSPWHIMLSRWGLESNLAPAFLIFGLFFWLKAMENTKFYPAAAFCYGLSLYCYAPLWIIVPLLLLLQFAYSVYTRKWKVDRYFILAVFILGFIALPLLLFLLVNNGIIPEIRTGLLSIPKMLEYRGSELSPANLKVSVIRLFRLLVGQEDGSIINTAEEFGYYYKFSLIFIALGLYGFIRDTAGYLKRREYSARAFVLLQIIPAVVFGLLISEVNTNKINAIHIPLILCCIQGFAELAALLRRNILGYAAFAYSLYLVFFCTYYFTEFNDRWCRMYWTGGREAINAALEKTEESVYFTETIMYPIILYYAQTPAPEYLETAEFAENSNKPVSFGRFVLGIDRNAIDDNGAYVVGIFEKTGFEEIGFSTETYGSYVVAWKEQGEP